MEFPSMRLDGKIAFVTGAGSGIGKVIAIGMAHNGADLAITELPDKKEAAEETAKEIEAEGRRALVIPLDVTNLVMISWAVEMALKNFGRIDILVNNAGINLYKWAVDVTEEDWDKVLDVNLKGVFFMSQILAKRCLIPQVSGKIINMASIMGQVGYYYRAPYCSSKAGVVNLTKALSIEWAQYQINVNAIAPTFVVTAENKAYFDNQEFYDDVIRRIPFGHIPTPEDLVGAAVYLASPAADMVTGHTLLVDGGWTAI